MSKILTSISREFVWRHPDANLIKAAIEGPIAQFLPDAHFNAEVVTEGEMTSRVTYEAVGEWLAGFADDADRISAGFSDYKNDRGVRFSLRPREAALTLSIDAPKADKADETAVKLLDALATDLGLTARSKQRAERIFTPSAKDFGWIASVVTLAKQLTGKSAQFNGRWDDGETRRDVKVEGEWLNAIQTSGHWEGEWRGLGHAVRMVYQKRFDEVRVELEACDEPSMTRMLDQVKLLAGLERQALNSELQGEARRCFVSAEITGSWYEKAFGVIRGFVDTSFWGRVERENEELTHRGYGSLDEWWSALQQGLATGDLAKSYISYNGQGRRLHFELDHFRSLLSIDVQSIRGEQVAETHHRLANELGLTPAPPDAYRYRRWGQTFDIEWDSPEAFAQALESALRALFRNRRVGLPVATLHMGNGEEEVQSFRTLPAFIKYLRDEAKNLTEVHLVAEGPGGEFMGVHLDKKLSRLRLLASTTTFKTFRTFQTALKVGLKSMKQGAELPEAAPSTSADTPKGQGWLLPLVLAIFTLAGVLFGTELYKAMRESPSIRIEQPPARDGQFEMSASGVRVRWVYITPKMFSSPTVDAEHPTWVEVTLVPGGQPVIPRTHHNGSVEIPPLPPGTYSVLLIAEGASTSLILKVLHASGNW